MICFGFSLHCEIGSRYSLFPRKAKQKLQFVLEERKMLICFPLHLCPFPLCPTLQQSWLPCASLQLFSTQLLVVWLLFSHLAPRLAACHHPDGHSAQKSLGSHRNTDSIQLLKVRLPQDCATCKCQAWPPTARIFQDLIRCQMPKSLQKQGWSKALLFLRDT